MLDFDSIAGRAVSELYGSRSSGTSRTASRNHYEWETPGGLRSGARVRLADGRSGKLTAPFPGCRGDGEWCGIFLDGGGEANIRPANVASVLDGSGWRPIGGRVAVTGAEASGKTVVYTVEFRDHGTDRMSATVIKDEGGGPEYAESGELDDAAELLNAIVQFEMNAEPRSTPRSREETAFLPGGRQLASPGGSPSSRTVPGRETAPDS
jgi:hypothetical protein